MNAYNAHRVHLNRVLRPGRWCPQLAWVNTAGRVAYARPGGVSTSISPRWGTPWTCRELNTGLTLMCKIFYVCILIPEFKVLLRSSNSDQHLYCMCPATPDS